MHMYVWKHIYLITEKLLKFAFQKISAVSKTTSDNYIKFRKIIIDISIISAN